MPVSAFVFDVETASNEISRKFFLAEGASVGEQLQDRGARHDHRGGGGGAAAFYGKKSVFIPPIMSGSAGFSTMYIWGGLDQEKFPPAF